MGGSSMVWERVMRLWFDYIRSQINFSTIGLWKLPHLPWKCLPLFGKCFPFLTKSLPFCYHKLSYKATSWQPFSIILLCPTSWIACSWVEVAQHVEDVSFFFFFSFLIKRVRIQSSKHTPIVFAFKLWPVRSNIGALFLAPWIYAHISIPYLYGHSLVPKLIILIILP